MPKVKNATSYFENGLKTGFEQSQFEQFTISPGQERKMSQDQKKEYCWVMIICLKFDCSKNLLDTILLLLDTIRAIIIFLVNCSNPVNLWESTGFEQFHFLSKKYQLFENQMLDKGGGKCQLLGTIYSKENGVHVRQLG